MLECCSSILALRISTFWIYLNNQFTIVYGIVHGLFATFCSQQKCLDDLFWKQLWQRLTECLEDGIEKWFMSPAWISRSFYFSLIVIVRPLDLALKKFQQEVACDAFPIPDLYMSFVGQFFFPRFLKEKKKTPDRKLGRKRIPENLPANDLTFEAQSYTEKDTCHKNPQ